MKQSNTRNNDQVRLKQLYDQRVPEGMTQKEFGSKFGIGSQSMVAQYLNGNRPLNYEAVAKFAKGLRCSIYDISPELAESLQIEILPFLGKALRRAALYAAFAVLPALMPSPSDAAAIRSLVLPTVYYVKRRVYLFILFVLKSLRTCALAHNLHLFHRIANLSCS